MSITDLFFNPVREVQYENQEDYSFALKSLNTLISISKIQDVSIYVIDYYKRKFAYVSDCPLFLCGHSAKEVQEWGFEYLQKIIPRNDLEMLLEINTKGFDFFYNLPIAERDRCFISYDFNLKHRNGSTILINQKLTPLNITRKGDMGFALCLISHSFNKTSGNVFIQMLDNSKRYNYSFGSKKFIEEDTIKLSGREQQVLKLMMNERATCKIASLLYVSENTIKHHKKNIYEKLGVNCMEEAIFYAKIKNLI